MRPEERDAACLFDMLNAARLIGESVEGSTSCGSGRGPRQCSCGRLLPADPQRPPLHAQVLGPIFRIE
jgi:hypothetical protein